MSTSSIYPGVSVQKSYNAINIEEKNDYNARMEALENGRKERERIRLEYERNRTFYERNETTIHGVCFITITIIVGLLALYIFSILLGVFVIVGNIVFETTMVFLFGRAVYNKNFPICTNDVYQGSDCYTRTSTYCT